MDKQATTFHDADALLDRLTDGISDQKKEVVFVVGAPLTAPTSEDDIGVSDVNAIISLIENVFISSPSQSKKLQDNLQQAINPYQKAFEFLSGRRGQDMANKIVKKAVAGSLIGNTETNWPDTISNLDGDQLSDLDKNDKIWHLQPGVSALGELIATVPQHFGNSVITSNFDPLIEVAIRKHGGKAWRTSLANDGNLDQSVAEGCQVVHIHGYWHGQDTLHTGGQLLQERPTLRNSLLVSDRKLS